MFKRTMFTGTLVVLVTMAGTFILILSLASREIQHEQVSRRNNVSAGHKNIAVSQAGEEVVDLGEIFILK